MHLDLKGHRLLFIHPGIYDDSAPASYPPWGPIYVATACRTRGADVYIADLNGQDLNRSVSDLVDYVQPTVVALTAKLGKGAERMRKAVDVVSAITSAPIAVGGPLIPLFPNPSLPLWANVRGLFWGDGEVEFPDWVEAGCPQSREVRPGRSATLDVYGLPTWWDGLGEYVSDAPYWPGLQVRSLHVSVARGCTRRCTFCYLNTQHPGRSFRVLSAERLLGGCDELNRRWGTDGFYAVDDCFLQPGSPETETLLEMLIRRGAPYRFGCDVQIQELADERLLRRMYAAGFRALYVGVEAASPGVRRRLGKGRCPRPLREVLQWALDAGFVIRASVGVGWPGETVQEMEETLALIRSLPNLSIDAFRYTRLPGSPLTSYRRRAENLCSAEDAPLDPFTDYSEFSSNHSDLPDMQLNAVWNELLSLERDRHAGYFHTENRVL